MTDEGAVLPGPRDGDPLTAVNDLVAGAAHDLNNPLSSISAFAQILLLDGGLTSAQRESVEVIKSESARAGNVIKDLLAVTRRGEPHGEPVELNPIVARVLRLSAHAFASNRIRVEQRLARDLPVVIGGERRLQQLCLNLVTSALHAMSPDGGTLSITTAVKNGRVVLDACDSARSNEGEASDSPGSNAAGRVAFRVVLTPAGIIPSDA